MRKQIIKLAIVWGIFVVIPSIMLWVECKFSPREYIAEISEKEIKNSIYWTEENSFEEDKDTVLLTWYNPIEAQCDPDPLITADNSKINLEKLKNREIRWIAVSRDLLDKYSMGDTVIIDSPNDKINGEWVIHDKMNKRFTKRIDLLVSEDEKYYGLRMPKTATIKKV